MAITMGYWDCPNCNHKRINGPERICPTCGRSREDDIEFYTDDEADVVDDPEMIRRARMGADWNCAYCGADNTAGTIECDNCGAGPDGAKVREQKILLDEPPKESAETTPLSGGEKESSSGRGGLLPFLLVAAAVAGLIWFFFVRTTDAKVTVTGSTWTKTLQIEKRVVEKKQAWADEVPAGAKELKRTKKKRTKKVQQGTRKVKVGKKDLGNGMFEDVYEERPKLVEKKVKEPWVTYKVVRWIQGKKLQTQAKDGKEPDDPVFNGSKKKRAGSKTSVLVVTVKGAGGKTYDYAVDMPASGAASKAARYKKGTRFTAKLNRMGKVLALE